MRLHDEIQTVLNRCSAENDSNTPDFLLASYLTACLEAFNDAVRERDLWYGIHPEPGSSTDVAAPGAQPSSPGPTHTEQESE